MASAELKVKRLARLESNCTCANCGTFNKYGFSTVCIKYHTFVCNMCKSSHQAISHRCKSLTMSAWTNAEVAELERKGNDHARRTWLKTAPPCGSGGRPSPEADLGVFKRFVVECYENKRYYGEDEGGESPIVAEVEKPVKAKKKSASRDKKTSSRRVGAVTAAPAPVVDLLDFGAEEVVPSAAPVSAGVSLSLDPFVTPAPASVPAAPAPPENPTSNGDLFQADFASFSTPGTSGTSNPPVDAFTGLYDNIGASAPQGNVVPTASSQANQSSVTNMNIMSGSNNGATSSGGFDPFNFQTQGTPAATQASQETDAFASFGNFESSSSSSSPKNTETAPSIIKESAHLNSMTSNKPVMGSNNNSGMSAISMMGNPNGGMSVPSWSSTPTQQQQPASMMQQPNMTLQQQQQMLMMQMQRMNITPQQMMMMQQQVMMQNMNLNQTSGVSMGQSSNTAAAHTNGSSNNNSSKNDAFAGISSFN